ncbi:MAG: ribonuclease HI, partial [Patescibacteria group bacterium]|nr:ribonuclease HI [Patescibacteria group bacterium]
MTKNGITVFTDGSSRGNPGPGGWGAIIRTQDEVTELGGGEEISTNNRMELSAAINALAFIDENDLAPADIRVVIQTDSKYLINGMTGWIEGWRKNGWKTAAKKDVENRELWEALHLVARGLSIEWRYVEGHAGHPGNERCDDIATSYADKREARLYQGPRALYTIDLDAAPVDQARKKRSSGKGVRAYSYLSLVDGVLEKHKTWAECESRVKGVRGAKFKKATSQADEETIAKGWG